MSLRRRYADLRDRYDARIAADEADRETDQAVTFVLSDFADQLDRIKTVVARRITAGDAELHAALTAAGVCIDPYLELARAEKKVTL